MENLIGNAVVIVIITVGSITLFANWAVGLGWAEGVLDNVETRWYHLLILIPAFFGVFTIAVHLVIIIAWMVIKKVAEVSFDLGYDLAEMMN